MSLKDELKKARKKIVTDGYEMSFGELMSLYKEGELTIDPDFQRLFRWDDSRKTKFIESLLLGIPIPPLFVFQTEDGTWELVDGLQRVSTVFEFAGILKNASGKILPPSRLNGTNLLPSLANKKWKSINKDDGIDKEIQIDIKRARARIEILKKDSDPFAKFELFQRLNTGGSPLSEQEVRNCILVMINKEFYLWIQKLAANTNFLDATSITRNAESRQKALELVLRFIIYRNVEYTNGIDVHDYLDNGAIRLASDAEFDTKNEEKIFNQTFRCIHRALSSNAFRKWSGDKFSGMFLISAFEIISVSISKNINEITKLNEAQADSFIKEKTMEIWGDTTFTKYIGAGVRGSTRLTKLLPTIDSFYRI